MMDCTDIHGLRIDDVFKSYGDQVALKGVSFHVMEREIVALLGPSGCGKSTVLAIVAGLEKADRGEICWNGVALEGISTHKRGFGLMFQDFALFPHQNVFDNVAFGLRMQGFAKEKIPVRVDEVLSLVGLPGFGLRDVNKLSGGEAQRVALARSMAPHPRLLMLDEPLGSLDRNLRERLMFDLRQILRASQQTAIYVTHDQEEAFAVADRIVLMDAGRVVQTGTPLQIYQHPKTSFVARFLGLENLMVGRMIRAQDALLVETPIGNFQLAPEALDGMFTDAARNAVGRVPMGNMQVLLRPDTVFPADAAEDDEGRYCHIRGRVRQISFRGNNSRVYLEIDGLQLRFDFLANVVLPAIGDPLELCFDPLEAIQLLPEQ